MKKIILLWAQARNGVIGHGQDIPWKLPEDQSRFKDMTAGHDVVMGRLTWESLPASVRPLPGRRNIVVTSDRRWSAAGAVRASGLEEAIREAGETVFIIGGGSIYRQAVPLATEAQITVIDIEPRGDTFAPALPGWEIDRGPWLESAGGLRYRFDRLVPDQRPSTAILAASASFA